MRTPLEGNQPNTAVARHLERMKFFMVGLLFSSACGFAGLIVPGMAPTTDATAVMLLLVNFAVFGVGALIDVLRRARGKRRRI